jgi:hypothetical protein
MIRIGTIRLITMLWSGLAAFAGDAMAQSGTSLPSDKPLTVYTGRGAGPARDEAAATQLLQRAEQQGRIRVIVGLNTTVRDEDTLPPGEAQKQSRELRRVQDAVAARVLGSASAEGVVRYSSIPFMSMFVDAGQLSRLLADPAVTSIQQDIPVAPTGN